jgi:hypothetical protein
MQYAVQQVSHHTFLTVDGGQRTNQTFARLPAVDRNHAENMAHALSEIPNVRRGSRHSNTSCAYEVVCQCRKADGSIVWLSLAEVEMIATMFTDPVAIAAE